MLAVAFMEIVISGTKKHRHNLAEHANLPKILNRYLSIWNKWQNPAETIRISYLIRQ